MKYFLRLVRLILRIPPPKVGREEAIQIALAYCEKRGWTLREPGAIEGLRTWKLTGMMVIGGPWMIIDQQTGLIVRKGCPPR